MVATPRIFLAFSAALTALAVACICSVAPALAASGSGGVRIGGDTSEAPTADASKYVPPWDKVARKDKPGPSRPPSASPAATPRRSGAAASTAAPSSSCSRHGRRPEIAGRRPDRLLVQDPGRRRRRADAPRRHRPLARLRLAVAPAGPRPHPRTSAGSLPPHGAADPRGDGPQGRGAGDEGRRRARDRGRLRPRVRVGDFDAEAIAGEAELQTIVFEALGRIDPDWQSQLRLAE